MFDTFQSWSAQHDFIYIVRAPVYEKQPSSSSSNVPLSSMNIESNNYWALIPLLSNTSPQPLSSSSTSSLIPNMFTNNTSSSSSYYHRNKPSNMSNMVLILLHDRDQLILPRFQSHLDCLTSQIQPALEASSDKIFEMNTLLVDEIKSYLEKTIVSSCGSPGLYDPWSFVSGKIDAKVIINTVVLLLSYLTLPSLVYM